MKSHLSVAKAQSSRTFCTSPNSLELLWIEHDFTAGKQVKQSVSLSGSPALTNQQQLVATERVRVNVDPSKGRERPKELETFASLKKDSPNQTTKADLWFKLRRWLIDVDLAHSDESDVDPALRPNSARLWCWERERESESEIIAIAALCLARPASCPCVAAFRVEWKIELPRCLPTAGNHSGCIMGIMKFCVGNLLVSACVGEIQKKNSLTSRWMDGLREEGE